MLHRVNPWRAFSCTILNKQQSYHQQTPTNCTLLLPKCSCTYAPIMFLLKHKHTYILMCVSACNIKPVHGIYFLRCLFTRRIDASYVCKHNLHDYIHRFSEMVKYFYRYKIKNIKYIKLHSVLEF